MGKLLSVNVGRPREVAWRGKTIRTAIWKTPVAGRVFAGRTNLAGDEQADLQGHGGEQRAVLVYQLSAYRYWSEQLGRGDFSYGQFGENLTVDGLEDAEVCIGDRYRIGGIGGALFEVTQPRVTCYRLGIRMQHPELPALLVSHRRPGFYMRVIETGEIGAGDDIVKVSDGPQRMSVADIDQLLYGGHHPEADLQRALRIHALSPGWQQSFAALLADQADRADRGNGGGNAALDPLASAADAWPGFRRMRVTQVERESAEVSSFWLEPLDGAPLPAALSGQHVVVRGHPDARQPVITRMYSLSGPSGGGRYRISVKREPLGAFSRYLHGEVRAGSTLELAAPRGAFHLRPGNQPVVLLSAGVGVTPLLSMLHELRRDAANGRPVWWFHSARNGTHHAFRGEARQLLDALPCAVSCIAYSQPDPADRPGEDFNVTGRLTLADLERSQVPVHADFYLCGPAGFIDAFTRQLPDLGVARERIHSEIFGAPVADIHAPAPHAPTGEPGHGHSVHFVRSGLSVRWSERYQSLLEMAEACDVPTRWSCRTGVCHNCQAALIEGEVDYRPAPLAPPARGTILLCCATPASDLELDL